MDTIVVGIDGSKGGLSAVRWAAKQAQSGSAQVVAVYVVPRTELWSLSAVQVDIDKVLAEFKDLLDGRWTAPLRKARVDYTTRLVRGDPASELLRIAGRRQASMLVLGSKSHSALTDLIVGGTVHKVINRSTIPVVLVPPVPVAAPKAVPARTAPKVRKVRRRSRPVESFVPPIA